jgi:RNA polymerase sigma factor (sigma-70 family)
MGRDPGLCEKCEREQQYALVCPRCRGDGLCYAKQCAASLDSEDLVQSSACALATYGIKASRKLFFGILKNKITDAIRATYRREFVVADETKQMEGECDIEVVVLEARECDLDSIVLVREIADLCDELVKDEEISEADLAMFEYHYYDGYTYAEIADALGLPAGTVSGNIARVRAEIRARVDVQPTQARN